MCKKFLRSAFVEEAAEKARWIIRFEARGPGDLENAMRRIEQRYGVPYGALWSLRYRPPPDILTSVYMRICEAHAAEVERQRKLIEQEAMFVHAKSFHHGRPPP